VVSYLHLHGLLDHYGEAAVAVLIGPLAIDGLMAVSTAALMSARPPTAPATDSDTDTGTDTTPDTGADTGTDTGADTGRDTGADMSGDMSGDGGADMRRRRARTSGPDKAGQRGTATPDAVARLRARHPDMPTAEIARRLKVTERTVRRHLNASGPDTGPDTAPDTGTGAEPDSGPGEQAA
jgi:DNA-binding CsgD family transcriptional regulator